MDKSDFDAQLRADGYTEIQTKAVAPRSTNDGHGHPYAVRGLVLAGAFTVIEDTKPTTYRPGEVFMVAAGKVHSEEGVPKAPKYWWDANIETPPRDREMPRGNPSPNVRLMREGLAIYGWRALHH